MKNYSPKPALPAELLEFLLLYSKLYLASGGPTSRLEESLVQIAARQGHNAEIFATPTGVFITLQDLARKQEPRTSLARLRDAGTDLGRLCKLEHVYTDLVEGRLSVHAAFETIRHPIIARPLYRNWHSGLAAFGFGVVISFLSYQRIPAALVSGLITATVWAASGFYLKRYLNNPLFTDFVGTFLTLVLAAVAHGYLAPLSLEAYALGGVVMLVPGLQLTTAISELAEQNLVSGTAKFMQASMSLLALGLAYLLFQQLAFSLELRNALLPVAAARPSTWISGPSILASVFCFSVILKVPPKAVAWATLTGGAGWMALQGISATRAEAAGPFLASVIVGVLSLTFGRMFRQPSQVYSVPGIVAMLPGMLALTSFRYFATGDQNSGIAFSFKVAITAASIVFGLMSARIPFQVGTTTKDNVIRGLQVAWRYNLWARRALEAAIRRESGK